MVVHHYEKECGAKNVGLLAVFKVTLTVRVSNRFMCVFQLFQWQAGSKD